MDCYEIIYMSLQQFMNFFETRCRIACKFMYDTFLKEWFVVSMRFSHHS